jgi:hypothetical protein
MGRHHQFAGDPSGHLGAVLPPDQVQAQVDPGRGARAGRHRPVDHVDAVGNDGHGRVHPGQVLRVRPMGRRRAPVEQTGGGEHEGAGAHRGHGRSALGRPGQRGDEVGPRGRYRRIRPGHHDQVGGLQPLPSVGRRDLEPGRGAQRSAFGGADRVALAG